MFIVVDGSQVNGERTGFASDGAATRTYNLGMYRTRFPGHTFMLCRLA